MKFQTLFSAKNEKKIINLSSADLAKRVVKVKHLGNLTRKDIFILSGCVFLHLD